MSANDPKRTFRRASLAVRATGILHLHNWQGRFHLPVRTSAVTVAVTVNVCSSFAGVGRQLNSDQCLPLIAIQARSWRSLKAFSVDCAKLGEGRVRQRECGRRQILMQVSDRRGARDQKNVGSAMEQPG